jgi:hypothetical protein
MSVEAILHVWDAKGVTAEEKLTLMWLANACGQLGYPVMIDPSAMGEFICSDFYRATGVLGALAEKGLIRCGTEDNETSSYIWLTNEEGIYEDPIDWLSEPRGRSRRVTALLERDGPGCVYCGCSPVVYEVDHFIPRARGGADRMGNLVLACAPCNRTKRDKMPEDFLANRPELLRELRVTLDMHEEDA